MRHLRSLATFLSLLATSLDLARASSDDLKIIITRPATCSRPSRKGDHIAVHYRGTLQSDGTEFDQSYNRGQPFTFILGTHQVIEGWDKGLLDMCPGEARTLIVPPEMAYGSRGAGGVIPGGATLVFETELMDIVGVEQETVSIGTATASIGTATASKTKDTFSIATAPSVPPEEDEVTTPVLEGTPLTSDAPASPMAVEETECHLLGPFALVVQAALGAVALLSLVYKRWREENKRPWKIWFFDVSKQVVGSMLTHVLNLAMSMLGSVDMVNTAKAAAAKATGSDTTIAGGRSTPNPCSFYLLNLGIDTTFGILILYLLLKILHVAFSYTPLARPQESIKSGHYGQPPRTTWWLKQSLIYFIGLTGMKLFVWSLFALLPWLPWVGDWALRWTEGDEALQVAFVLFIFPLAMNALQYWIIDSLIMDKSRGKDAAGEYSQVGQGSEDYDDAGEEGTLQSESIRGKSSDEDDIAPKLKEVNPTPMPSYDDSEGRAQSSRGPTPPTGESR